MAGTSLGGGNRCPSSSENDLFEFMHVIKIQVKAINWRSTEVITPSVNYAVSELRR